MSTQYISGVLLVVFGVMSPMFVQCKPLELISDIDEHGLELPSNVNLIAITPIPIISQTDTSSPDGSFSYRCVHCVQCVDTENELKNRQTMPIDSRIINVSVSVLF